MRLLVVIAAGTLLALAATSSAPAAPEDAAPGSVRAVLARSGAVLRERPAPLAPAAATVPHGTRVRVAARQGRWLRVETLAGAEAAAGGWLRDLETVEPFALTQGGRRGPVAGRTGAPTEAELSAAGRQFDEETEKAYRQQNPDLDRFYPLVDAIEAVKPDPDEIRLFVLEGRLGRPEPVR